MEKIYFNIAEIEVGFCHNNKREAVWQLFQNEKNDLSLGINLQIINYENMKNSYGFLFTHLTSVTHLICKNKDIAIADKEWKNYYIFPLHEQNNLFEFEQLSFYTHAVQRRMLQLHSSLIDFQGQGLMFLGPSGIGKTTQAELWNRYRDARIINGDIVFVQEKEDCFLGWGTPWHGSSPYCENASVPVKALVVLKQAPENSIRELTGFEKVTAVSNSVFYPQWLENGMELCLETLDHLLTRLPVYELRCRPDEEAVKLTEETIFH